jgi:hypothetical protein
VRIYSFEDKVYIRTLPGYNGIATVYDLPGRILISQPIEAGTLNVVKKAMPSGYYIVKFISNGLTTTEKVFIR